MNSDSFERFEAFGLEDDLAEQTEILVETIKDAFRDWIESLEYPEWLDQEIMLQCFGEKDQFITFNYTDTLERYYQVSRSAILYLHNKAEELKGDLIFGHGIEQESNPRPEELDEDGNSNRTVFTDAEDVARRVFYDLQKDTESIIKEHNEFFKQLSSIDTIRVLGHSLGEVDWPYLKYFKKLLPNAHWQFSYYGEKDMGNIKNVCLETLELNWADVRLIRLSELVGS